MCDGKHPLSICFRFRRLTVEKRLRVMVKHRYCARCLAQSHSTSECRSQAKCGVCSEDHNTMLHIDFPRANRQRQQGLQRRGLVSSSSRQLRTSALMICADVAPVTLLPTCCIFAWVGQHKILLRGLLDPCTENNRIAISTVRRSRMPYTATGLVQTCSFTVSSTHDPATRLTISCEIVPDFELRTPAQELPETLKSDLSNFRLADPTFWRKSGIQLSFGGSTYHKIIRPNLSRLRGLPLAQDTIFGWVLSGPCAV